MSVKTVKFNERDVNIFLDDDVVWIGAKDAARLMGYHDPNYAIRKYISENQKIPKSVLLKNFTGTAPPRWKSNTFMINKFGTSQIKSKRSKVFREWFESLY